MTLRQRVVDGLNAGKSHIKDVPSRKSPSFAPRVASRRPRTPSAWRSRHDFDLRPDAALEVQGPRCVVHRRGDRSGQGDAASRQVIILESTTYPGTTREIMLPALESTGLKVGEDFFLAFSPERVDPGNPKYGTKNTPKVVGGITPDCHRVACAMYAPAHRHARAGQHHRRRRNSSSCSRTPFAA